MAARGIPELSPARSRRHGKQRDHPRHGARAVAAAALLGLAVVLAACPRRVDPPTIADLVRAAGDRRPVEPRLTGGFSHAVCGPARDSGQAIPVQHCSPPPADRAARLALARVVQRLQIAVRRGAPVEARTLQAAGVGALLWPASAQAIEHGVRDLEAAAAARGPSAAVLSDLAAAYMVRAAANQDPRDLVKALGRAGRALEMDGALSEAAFNRALALEDLGIGSGAAWRDYLRLDGSSAWSEEARQHLDALSHRAMAWRWPAALARLEKAAGSDDPAGVGAVVARFPLGARLHLEEDLLPQWGEAWREGDLARSAPLLVAARLISEALTRFGGDALPADSVRHLDVLARMGPAGRLSALAAGLAAFGDGLRARRQEHILAAEDRFGEGERLLRQAGSPFAAWPAFYRAVCAYTREDYRAALDRLGALVRETDGSSHRNLTGRAYWVMGLSRVALAQPAEALAAYRRSLAAFKLSGEEESAVAVEGLIANVMRYAGEERACWRYCHAALMGIHRLEEARRRLVVLGEAAQSAVQLGEADSAICFADEALRLIQRRGNALDLAEGLRIRAGIELQQHRDGAALASLRQARTELQLLHEPSLEQAVLAEILDAEGNLLAARDPQGALGPLAAAAELFRQTRFISRLADCYVEQARVLLAAGRRDEARGRLFTAVTVVEAEWRRTVAHRGELAAKELGPGYPERRRRVFDMLLGLLTEGADAAAAFDFAERSHGWDLLAEALELPAGRADAPALRIARPLGHQMIQESLPPGTALVEYALLPDRLAVWTLTREHLGMMVTPVGNAAACAEVERLFSALQAANRDDLRTSQEGLHDLLLRPLRAALAGSTRLVIVPDGCLGAVPWSALRDRAMGRPVIADRSVAVSPSASVFAGAMARASQFRSPRDASALVVGNPANLSSPPAEGPALPGAADEAAHVAVLYPGAVALSGREATASRFLDLAAAHSIVHFAGHAHTGAGPALVASLQLAPSEKTGDTGAVYAYELLRRPLPRTRLFVLSACDTAGGGGRRLAGFVRPLLAAGVPSIVASLWLVEDRPTADLMAVFHARYRESGDASDALRAAQLAVIAASPDHGVDISLWGAFEAFGASGAARSAGGRDR